VKFTSSAGWGGTNVHIAQSCKPVRSLLHRREACNLLGERNFNH
jgi:hypothetical protein